MKVIIRADGNFEIGLGHLYRCFSLARMLSEEYDISFHCADVPDSFVSELTANGFRFKRVSGDSFTEELPGNCIVVLDGYHFGLSLQETIKKKGCKLVCIDDFPDRKYYADLVINNANGIRCELLDAEPYTQCAIGLDYALLRPRFLEQAKKHRKVSGITSLMICFGGSDYKNLTQRALELALQQKQLQKITVVTGAAFSKKPGFENMLASDDRIVHRHSLAEDEMLRTMLDSDLAIVPASSVLLEALSAGCIIISGFYVDNQKILYESLKNENLFTDAGDFSEANLKRALSQAFTLTPERKRLIDGQSGTRLLKLFRQLQSEFSCILRPAGKKDMEITYSWASDPEIRKFSFTRHLITKQEHSAWFERKISDNNCTYLIFEYMNVPAGSIRFDRTDDEVLISYLISAEYHGRGFGSIILKKGIEWIISEKKGFAAPVKIIRGIVMKQNIPSVRSFIRLGFRMYDENENFRFEKVIL